MDLHKVELILVQPLFLIPRNQLTAFSMSCEFMSCELTVKAGNLISFEWRETLSEYVRLNALPVEKYGHQPRLYALTLKVGAGLAYDDDVVYAATWLHDLGVFAGHRPEDLQQLARWDHVAYAVEKVPGILDECGFDGTKVAAVLECIRNHQPKDEPQSVESTILRDADILEQLGAVGIMRTVCKVGRDTRFATFSDAAASLQKAIVELPGKLRLETSRKLARERMRVHREFLAALAGEADGRLF